MLESMRRDLEAINYEANTGYVCLQDPHLVTHSDATVESVSKNIASLSKEERLQLLTQDSPELLRLLQDLHRYMDEVKNHIVLLLKRCISLYLFIYLFIILFGWYSWQLAEFAPSSCQPKRV